MEEKSMKNTLPDLLKIAVIGGGNIGTQFACLLAYKGFCVNVHTSKPYKYDGELEIVNEKDEIIIGRPNLITDDIGKAVKDCDVVFVTHPAFQLRDTAEKILPYVNSAMRIVMIPGTGGTEFAFHDCINAGAVLYGLQRVPSVARLEQYGKKVRCEGLRDKLHIASLPKSDSLLISELLQYVFEIPCIVLPNYLCITLVPSNPILHTTRLRTLFSDYEKGKVYDHNPLFYGEWNDSSSELLIACDDELQQMCKIIEKLDLSSVRSLKLHYESRTVKEMTKKIRSIKSLQNLYSPMKKADNGWIPDFNSRYFTADFPFGLAILEELSDILDYNAKNIKETMSWYRKVTGNTEKLNLSDYGISTLNDIYNFYCNE